MHRHEWCYLSGWINVLEGYLLTMDFFERLLSTGDFKDLLTQITNTPLKAYFTQGKHLYGFETLLRDYYYNRLYEIRSLSPDSTICDLFLIHGGICNIRHSIKASVLRVEREKSWKEAEYPEEWKDVWQGKPIPLPEVFKKTISLFKTEATAREKEILPFLIDLAFDSAYLKYIESVYHEMRVEIIKGYLKTYQLVRGIEIIWRAVALKFDMDLFNRYFLEGFDQKHLFRKLVVQGAWRSEKVLQEILEAYLMQANSTSASNVVNGGNGSPLYMQQKDYKDLIHILLENLSGNLSFRYRVATDNYLLDIIRPVKRVLFGPERVFGYLCGFTTEVFNVKLVLGGKVHGVESSLLRERLRGTYG